MNIDKLNRTIDGWLAALDAYTLQQLRTKPAPGSWSLGQVYMHLLQDTRFYIEQIKSCLHDPSHLEEEATPHGRWMLAADAFPDEQIEGDPANALMPQPVSKEQLLRELTGIKAELNQLATQAATTSAQGKSQHPGLGYFSAAEWLQFADMHFRHHLRQKKRLTIFSGSEAGTPLANKSDGNNATTSCLSLLKSYI